VFFCSTVVGIKCKDGVVLVYLAYFSLFLWHCNLVQWFFFGQLLSLFPVFKRVDHVAWFCGVCSVGS
jgi:hypothetical protein